MPCTPHGIKMIINLRNETHGAWYTQKKFSAAQRDVTLIDYPLGSAEMVSVESSEELAEIIRTTENRS